jgi:hypothetical protein
MIAYNPSIVRDGLVLHLDAANVKSYPGSGTVWTDLSGNGNNGTLMNGVGYSSDNKGSLTFDGVDDYCHTFTDNSYLSNGFTLSAWVNPASAGGGGYGRIFDKTNNNTGSAGGISFYFSNSPNVTITVNNGAAVNSTANSVPYTKWTNVSVSVISTGSAIIYINGVVNSTGTTGLPSAITTLYELRLGNRSNAIDRTFSGKISLAQIYNRALSAQEIRQNFEATKGRYGI